MGLGHSACIVSLGCPKNLVDSEHLAASMAGAGYRLTANAGAADVVVLTTCAFLKAAVEESEQAARRLVSLKRRRPDMKVVVAGCLVQRYGAKLKNRLPGVDLFVPLAHMPFLPSLLPSSSSLVPDPRSPTPRLLSTPRHYAYLKIAEGCNNRCSYCLIPGIRGPLHSRPMNEILKEAESLARMGVKELILIAQDTTAYGTDIHSKPALPRLLRKLSRIRSIHWLRLMYTHPAHVTGELVAEFETNPKLCRYIDLPFQHVSDRILGRMGRRHCRRDVELLLTRLKSIPELHIRTTLITGFPGETEAEFEELLDFVRQAELDRLGGYAFSPEPGTRAARLKNQVPPRTRQERLRKLMRVQAAISRRKLRRLLGRIVPVVIDRPGIGRTEWDAPEIDGVVKLSGPSPKPGTFVRVHVLRTGTHDITAERRKPQ